MISSCPLSTRDHSNFCSRFTSSVFSACALSTLGIARIIWDDLTSDDRKIPQLEHCSSWGLMEPPARIELATFSLRVKCSTD